MPSTNGHGSKPERVALYLRVSTDEQRDRETIEIQGDFLEQYRSLYELEGAGIYKDDGISGTIPLHERPEGRRLLADAKEGKFTAVVVYRLDRLGRSLLVIVDAHDRLQEAGVALRSATEPIDTSTPSGRLIFQMLASFAEYERAAIGERTRAGLHRAARNGCHMGPLPYGYRAGEDGRLEVVEEEAEIVRQIFSNIADGSTLGSEAARLNALGIAPPGSRNARKQAKLQWRPTGIWNIIRNRAYAGTNEIHLTTGEVVEQVVPQIVAPELRAQALDQLEENRRYSGGPRRREYLLRGLVQCAHCGCTCIGQTHLARGKQYAYYHCNDDRNSRSFRGPRHSAPFVNAHWLEETVWADVRLFLQDPGEVLERIHAQVESNGEAAELEERHASLETRLAAKHKERDRWLHLYAQDHISEHELEIHLADLRAQLDNLRLLLASVESDLQRKHEEQGLASNAKAWLLVLRERLSEVEEDTEEAFEKRRALVKLLVAGITAGRNDDDQLNVQITYRFGPPTPSHEEDMFVASVQSSCR
jgi:site-specific DNA recombinase